jgi:PAS domain S-box-containing protein
MIKMEQVETWCILHIEDDEEDHCIVQHMLNRARSRNVSLEWASTLQEGREKLSANTYQAVLVDYDLVLGSGVDLIREFAEREYAPPLILLTGLGSYDLDLEAMHAGATLYLTKSELNPLLLERSIRYAIKLKTKEKELRERDQKLTVALAAAELGAWTYTFADDMLEMDERAQEMYRAEKPVEWHTRIVEDFIHPEDVPAMQAALENAADPAGGGSYFAEYRILQPAGTYRWLSAWGQTEFEGLGADRRGVRMMGASRDITWEKQSRLALEQSNAALRERETALNDSKARFRDLANNISQLAWMMDSEGRGTWYNQRWYDYTDTTFEEMQGWGWQKVHHPDHIERVKNSKKRSLERGEVWEETFPLRGRDGQYRWFLTRAVPIRDEAGKIERWFGTNTDVTELRLAEAALRRSEAKTREILESISDGFFAFDREWRVTFINQRAAEQGRRRAEDLIGTVIWESKPELQKTPLAEVYQRVMNEERAETFEFLSKRTGRWFQLNIYPSADGISVYSVDITGRKQADAVQQQLLDENRRQKNLLERLVQAVPVGIAFLEGQQHIYTLANPEHERLACGKGELIGRSVAEIYPELAAIVIPQLDRVYQTGESFSIQDAPLKILRDGAVEENYYSYSLVPICKADGSIDGVMFLSIETTQAVHNHRAVVAQSAQLKAVLNALPVGVWIADREGRLVSKNEQADRIWAGEAPLVEQIDQYVQYTAWRPDSEELLAAEEYPLARTLRSGQPAGPDELRIRRFDGSLGYVLVSTTPVYDGGDRFTGAVTINVDISEQKRVEAALRDSERGLRQLADAMPQLVWTAMPDGTVDYFNERHLHYGGVTQVGEDRWVWGPMLHPEDLPTSLEAWSQAVERGETYQIEHRVLMADGSYRWHLTRGIPVHNEQGQCVKWYGTSTDIEHFKEIQEALHQRDQRLRGLFESTMIGILTRSADGRVIEANDAYLKITGYTSEEVQAGQVNVRGISPAEYHAQDHDYSQQVLTQGFCRPYEKEYLRKDGTRVPVLIGYSLIEGKQPEFTGFVLDLSELKQTQAMLTAYAEKLKRSNEELENFAFMASHDLQEPVRKVVQLGRCLRSELDGQISEEAEGYLDRMQNAARRMQAMIDGLLNLSRVSTSGSEFIQVHLNTIAQEVVEDLEALIKKSEGRVVVDDLPVVQGDPLQLRQLLVNLIGNALKYQRKGVPPVVEVTGEEVVEGLRLVVADNGTGFDESQADSIFKPFIRLHGRKYAGSGMGLAICNKIVERHGGTIAARSELDKGSVFIVTLPHPPEPAS